MLWLNGIADGAALLEHIDHEVVEIAHHLHNRERWFGIVAPQTAVDWGEQTSLVPYRAISGAGIFGVDANDEAQVLGTADTPAIAGMAYFDAHRIEVLAASNADEYVLRLVYGTGTMAAAELAGQYSDMMITDARKGAPIDVLMPRIPAGWQLWIRSKNAANNATIDFFIGIHEYIK